MGNALLIAGTVLQVAAFAEGTSVWLTGLCAMLYGAGMLVFGLYGTHE